MWLCGLSRPISAVCPHAIEPFRIPLASCQRRLSHPLESPGLDGRPSESRLGKLLGRTQSQMHVAISRYQCAD